MAHEPPPRERIELTDPRALRALAHPTRLRLVGLLRTHGELTASRAGELVGQSPASCSFHLRQLAKYGLVEEAGRRGGRERPWRATAWFTSWPDVAPTPELAEASKMLTAVIAERWFEEIMRWIEARDQAPPEWREAAAFGDTIVYLTAAELAALQARVQELVASYQPRTHAPELRPPGSRGVVYLQVAFPAESGD